MAGRVLSKKNETMLRQALDALDMVLSTIGEDDAEAEEAQEAGDLAGEFVPLVESAVRADGSALLRVIVPGWGSSGFYPAEVLKRDGPRIFKAGQTKMWWDHASPAEEAERPEGSLTNLAGELIGDAYWNDAGPAGPGLYAEAKVFGPYRTAVNELAPHIGVSIRASGRTKQGEAEGRKGPIVEELVAARSIDYVVTPGAGGKIVQMFEAARPRTAAPMTQANLAIDEGGEMDKELETKFAEAQAESQKRIDALAAENARMREGLILRDAREAVREALAGATVPDVTRARLLEQLSANPPTVEGALDRTALAAKITEAVAAEQAYLAQAAGYGSGRITGMGGAAGEPAAVDVSGRMKEAFGLLGLSDAEASVAAKGRGW